MTTLIVLASFFLEPSLAADKNYATIEEVIYTQQIEIRSPEGGRQVPALLSQVPVNSRVITGKEGQVAFRMPDQSLVRVGPLSDIRLDSMRPDQSTVTVEHGRMILKVKPSPPPHQRNKFVVRTRNAVMGVRGTEFTVRVEKNDDLVVHTLSGVVDVSRNQEAPGQRVSLTRGKAIEIRSDGTERQFEFDPANHESQFFTAPMSNSESSLIGRLWRWILRMFGK